MVLRLLAAPAVALLTLALAPPPVTERPSRAPHSPVPVAAAPGGRPSAAEWEELVTADPLAALQAARDRYAAEVTGFSARMHKQERIAGVLQPPEVINVLVREQPFAVRMLWVSGSRKVLGNALEGALYSAGENGGRMTVWRPSAFVNFLRYTDVSPTDGTARAAARYSLAEAGLGHTLNRTLAAWTRANERGPGTIAYLGARPVAELGGKRCHVVRRTCTPPEGDRFLAGDPEPSAERFATSLVFLDPETWVQVGAELRRADGELVGSYYFRDVTLNPTFGAKDFTREGLAK